MEEKLFVTYIESPVGYLEIRTTAEALYGISFVKNKGLNTQAQSEILTKTIEQLNEYFYGNRKEFSLKLKPTGSDFQKKVWNCVENVGFGKTATYLEIAKQTGSEKNTRAVGLANAKNPIPIIIPCHRIIGSNGKLTGYAGGLQIKQWLLRHELKYSEYPGLLF